MNKVINNEYEKLVGLFNSLSALTGKELEKRRMQFIINVLKNYDMVMIGAIYWGNIGVDVESVYYDKKENQLMIYISGEEMEGNILYHSLQEEKQKEIARLVFEEMKHIEEGPTLLGMMVAGNNILYRNVRIKELDAEIRVTTEEVYSAYIKEGSTEDDLFYCYVPEDKFSTLNDQEFEDYVNTNF